MKKANGVGDTRTTGGVELKGDAESILMGDLV